MDQDHRGQKLSDRLLDQGEGLCDRRKEERTADQEVIASSAMASGGHKELI